eukprot:5662-Heterococcus_DN1.PRE.9
MHLNEQHQLTSAAHKSNFRGVTMMAAAQALLHFYHVVAAAELGARILARYSATLVLLHACYELAESAVLFTAMMICNCNKANVRNSILQRNSSHSPIHSAGNAVLLAVPALHRDHVLAAALTATAATVMLQRTITLLTVTMVPPVQRCTNYYLHSSTVNCYCGTAQLLLPPTLRAH